MNQQNNRIPLSIRTFFSRLGVSLALLVLGVSTHNLVWAHGYVQAPESRAFLCSKGLNQGCGSIIYEPQSVEGSDGFPEAGPKDGQLASAGNAAFAPLDQMGIARWWKTWVQVGSLEVTWRFTAPHRSKNFRYFITKADWDPSLPLTRAQFEAAPFCAVDFQNQKPDPVWTHRCDLPDREGYHVVLAVWDVADTVNSFYNAIDLYYGAPAAGLPELAAIADDQRLAVGSVVRLTFEDASGPRDDLTFEYRINSAQQGQANVWPKAFATALNHVLPSVIRAGVEVEGNIQPAERLNRIYAFDSNIVAAKVSVNGGSPTKPLMVKGVKDHYVLDEANGLSLEALFSAKMSATLEIKVINDSAPLLQETLMINQGDTPWKAYISEASAGLYILNLKWVDEEGVEGRVTQGFEVWKPDTGGDYDYRFPEGLGAYKPATVVLGRDGLRYRCKPFPFSGWCNIYSEQSTHYEPGFGSDWQDAWELIGR